MSVADGYDTIDDWLSDQPALVVLDASSVTGAPKPFLVLEPTGDEDGWDGADPHWFGSALDAADFLRSIYDPADEVALPVGVGFV